MAESWKTECLIDFLERERADRAALIAITLLT